MNTLAQPKIIRSQRKTIALQILPDASLVVKAPMRMPLHFIQKFIEENLEWIEKKSKQLQVYAPSTANTYENGSKFHFLGKIHTLHIGNFTNIAIREEELLFPQAAHFRIKKELTNWYIRQGKKIITEQVEWYAKQMNASYTDLTFSDTKSQWGRCTHDNRLQFNWRLVMAPLLTINYVVVHELAHTTEKNHSRSFWNKVRFHNPSFRQQIKYLKENGHTLIV